MSVTVFSYDDAPGHLRGLYLSSEHDGGGDEDFLLHYHASSEGVAQHIAERLAIYACTPPIPVIDGWLDGWKIIVTRHA